jgi:negative regulator of replication initiation
MKHEYREGHEALERFEKTMTALFRVTKNAVAEKTKKPVVKQRNSARFSDYVCRALAAS